MTLLSASHSPEKDVAWLTIGIALGKALVIGKFILVGPILLMLLVLIPMMFTLELDRALAKKD